MNNKLKYIAILIVAFALQVGTAQDKKNYETKVEKLEKLKIEITSQEKEALKIEIEAINKRLEKKQITESEAQRLKESAAKKRALNIENRLSILDNQIALIERNNGQVLELDTLNSGSKIEIGFGHKDDHDDKIFGIKFSDSKKNYELKYDVRTYSDIVIAVGFNNAVIDGEILDDSPYKIGGSRFFEMGWQWRTRVFQNSNFLRLNYGFSFQFNGLKPTDNRYFVNNNDEIVLEEFDVELDKAKLRMDNLVFPIHFEFGPSKIRKNENSIRYSLDKKFRVGLGGYGGFNLGTRQKLKYERDGDNIKDKLKRDYNTSNLIYGLSAYAGFGGTTLYMKYDLNPIFRDALVEQNNISLGLRFDL
ncbi:hypothetical protein [Cellulophaga sp. Hel_I_12]|uniref:hypothetical protein n=1 Tax=Cellulophaga sp. Hel_I_12 TaxID=1249972 RepID=UPI000645964B|nr:hypothetical protein [Cellulophaga sp. Hel_I_12]